MNEWLDLIRTMNTLREKCPWDREQTLSTLKKYLIEETAETLEALDEFIDRPSDISRDHLIEELGDLQLQIVFQAKLISELTGRAVISEILSTINSKLIRRHPHVFVDSAVAQSSEQVKENWEKIKDLESPNRMKSALDGIPKTLSSLCRAQKIGDRTQKVQFDWQTSEEVWQQVQRETTELLDARVHREREEELGDLLFTLVQWARHENIDAESALSRACQKFEHRFRKVEKSCQDQNKNLKDLTDEEKEALWREAKRSPTQD